MNWTTGSRSTVKKNLQRQKQQQFFQKQRQQTTITGVDFAAPGRAWAIVAGKERKDSKCAHGSNPTSKSNADPQVSLDLINLLGLSPKAAGTGGKNHSRRAAVTTPSRASTPLTFHTPTERSMERADSSRGNQNPTSMGAGSNADLSPRSLPESTSSKGRTADWDAFLTSEHRLKGSEEVVQKEASSETPGQIEDEESEELSMSSSPKDVQKTLTPHTAMEHVEFTNFLKEPSINWQQCSSPDTLSSIASFTGISKHASQNWNDFLASPLGIIMKRKGFGFDDESSNAGSDLNEISASKRPGKQCCGQDHLGSKILDTLQRQGEAIQSVAAEINKLASTVAHLEEVAQEWLGRYEAATTSKLDVHSLRVDHAEAPQSPVHSITSLAGVRS